MSSSNPEATRSLHASFGKVIEMAWQGSNSVVQSGPQIQHEACHVARFVYGVPAGMVAAIKLLDVANASVTGMFCHRSPYAFWSHPDGPGLRLQCRELADLMIEVELVEKGRSYRRALLVQVKKGKKGQPWTRSMEIGVAEFQRFLYLSLPTFSLETGFQGTTTKAKLERAGITDITGEKGIPLFNLSSLINHQSAGLVYVGVNPAYRSNLPPPAPPWLAEEGLPSRSLSSATVDVDFALALAEMVVERRPRFGVRSEGARPSADWESLINHLHLFARTRENELVWKNGRALDIVLNKSKDPKVLYNVQKIVTIHGELASFWSCATSRPSMPEDLWLDDLDRSEALRPDTNIIDRTLAGDGEPYWPETVMGIPKGGFGVLQIRVELDDEPLKKR